MYSYEADDETELNRGLSRQTKNINITTNYAVCTQRRRPKSKYWQNQIITDI